jgi:hypothetical protein
MYGVTFRKTLNNCLFCDSPHQVSRQNYTAAGTAGADGTYWYLLVHTGTYCYLLLCEARMLIHFMNILLT